MRRSGTRSRLLLGAVMAAALGGATVATVAVLERTPAPFDVAVGSTAPTENAEEGGGSDTVDDPEREVVVPARPELTEAPVTEEAPGGFGVADSSFIECVGDDWVPSDGELEAANTETEALRAVLDAAGIDHTVITDPHGFTFVEWDYGDGVAQAVTTSFSRDRYPPEPIPEAELARIRDENAALVAALDAAGAAYEVITDPGGWEFVEYDDEDPAAQAVVDDFYTELYPPDPIPEDELARIRDENAGLIAVLEGAGVTYEVMREPDGWEWVEWDDEDPAAAAVVDGYFTGLYPPEPIPEDELARIREENGALMEALEAGGIAYEVTTEPGGWEFVEYDVEDPAAQEIVDAFYLDRYGGDCYDGEWEPSAEEIEANNTETDRLAATFDAAGMAYTVETDDLGFRWLEWDYDDPAAQAVADEFWGIERAATAAEIGADLDRLAAAFDDAGIGYVREGHDECETIIFDVTDTAALAAVAALG